MSGLANFLLSEQLSQMGVLPIVITGIVSLVVAIIANKINGIQANTSIHTTINNSFNNNVINNTNIYVVNKINNDDLAVAACMLILLFLGYMKYGLVAINVLYIISIFLILFPILYIALTLIKENISFFSILPFLLCIAISLLAIMFIDYAESNFLYYVNNYSQLNFSIHNFEIYTWILMQAISISSIFVALYMSVKNIYASIYGKSLKKQLNMLISPPIFVIIYYLGVSGYLYTIIRTYIFNK